MKEATTAPSCAPIRDVHELARAADYRFARKEVRRAGWPVWISAESSSQKPPPLEILCNRSSIQGRWDAEGGKKGWAFKSDWEYPCLCWNRLERSCSHQERANIPLYLPKAEMQGRDGRLTTSLPDSQSYFPSDKVTFLLVSAIMPWKRINNFYCWCWKNCHYLLLHSFFPHLQEISDNVHKPTHHIRNNSGMGRVCSSQQLDHCRAPHASICNHISAWEELTRGMTHSSCAEDARTAPCPWATRRWEPTPPGLRQGPPCPQSNVPIHDRATACDPWWHWQCGHEQPQSHPTCAPSPGLSERGCGDGHQCAGDCRFTGALQGPTSDTGTTPAPRRTCPKAHSPRKAIFHSSIKYILDYFSVWEFAEFPVMLFR